MTRFGFLLLVMLFALSTHAGVDVHQFDDPTQEARYKKLVAELRCTVCQNQNLADSNADLAQDLRNKVYEMIRAGRTDGEIYAYMVERYGDFILYRPPMKSSTVLLWIGPFVFMGVGVVLLINFIRRRRAEASAGIEEDRLEKARHLLEQEDKSA